MDPIGGGITSLFREGMGGGSKKTEGSWNYILGSSEELKKRNRR